MAIPNAPQLKQAVTPEGPWFAAHKKSLVPTILVLILLIIGAGFWYRQVNKPTASQEETTSALQASAGLSDEEAVAELKAAYDDAATEEGKADAAYYLAARYSDLENHQQALYYYREADRLKAGQDINVVLGVANEAEAAGNNDLAREYYQKAIDYYEPLVEANPELEQLINRFNAKLEELKN